MLKITSSGIPGTLEFLDKIRRDLRPVATRAFAKYIVGDERHGLKHYPFYRHVPWASIGGFVSDRQRRYVMANIREGKITPGISASNGYLRDAWKYELHGTGYSIKNDVSYGGYLVGNQQSRRAVAQGWRTVLQNAMDNFKGACRAAEDEVKRWLKASKR